MYFRLTLFTIFLSLLFTACKGTTSESRKNEKVEIQEVTETNHPDFVSQMEVAHQKARLLKNGVICFNLDLTFGSRNSKMKIFTTPTSSSIRMDKNDGPSSVMINGALYTDGDSSLWEKERFAIYTYQYFFMAPYKFSDEGTIWTRLPDMDIEGKRTNRAKLTFEPGTGDAPDDWYMVHSDPESHLVNYIGYIVTAGGMSVDEAEKNAHAIKYSDYKMVAEVPIAFKWEFFNYSKDSGLGDKIGEAILKNVEMMDEVDQFDIIHDGTFVKISE
jgi:hypothetical protein